MKKLYKLLLKYWKIVTLIGFLIGFIASISTIYPLILKLLGYLHSFFLFKLELPIYLLILLMLMPILFVLGCIFIIIRIRTRELTLKILKAPYGIEGKRIDIKSGLNELILGNKLDYPLGNDICGSDPAPHSKKTCVIEYRYGKLTRNKKYIEEQQIKLPRFLDQLRFQ